VQSRIGRIHAAHGGTLFLDEIGDMPLSLQSKILRFLEQGEVQRWAATTISRWMSAWSLPPTPTSRSLISEQKFREDLYYRLAVFPIHLPPLRERMSDLEELAVAFTPNSTRRFAKPRSVAGSGAAQRGRETCASCATRSNGRQSSWDLDEKSSPSTFFFSPHICPFLGTLGIGSQFGTPSCN
jgi:transcriptional regulator with AAA-type ATPase domain